MSKKNITKSLPNIKFSSKKYSITILIFISFLIFWFVFQDFITGHFLFFFKDIGSDNVNITLPNYLHGKYLRQEGAGFTGWSFYDGLGKMQPSKIILNPIFWINYLIINIFGSNYNFYRIYPILLFYVLPSGIFAFLYFRTLNYFKYTAIIGALLYEFSGYMMVGMQWGHANELLYFIILLFSFEQFLQKKRWYFLPLAYVLSSNPYFLATASVFLGIYAVFRYYDQNGNMKKFIPFMLKIAGLALIGILINAPRIFESFYNMLNSPRVSGDVNQAAQLIANPENINAYLRNVTLILRTFSNDLMGSGSDFKGWYNYLEAPLFYIGLLTLILLPLSFHFIEKKKRWYYAVFLGFWVLVAFIPLLRHALNFFVGNYYKITIDVFVPFTLLFFAMFTLENLLKKDFSDHLLLVVSVGILLVLLHFPYFKNNGSVVNLGMQIILSLFILTEAFLIYLLTKKKNTELIKILLLLTVIAELIYVAYPSANKRKKYKRTEIIYELAGYNDGTIDAIKYIKQQDTSKFYRIEKDYSSGNAQHSSLNDAMAQGYFGTTCYGSFNQINYIRFLETMNIIPKGNEARTRWCTGVRGIPILMSFVSVKYFLTHNPSSELRYDGYDSLTTVKNIIILKNKYVLPLGFAYTKYINKNDFQKLNDFKKQEALLNSVVIDNLNGEIKLQKLDTNKLVDINSFNLNLYAEMIDSLRQRSFMINEFSHNHITGTITTDKPALLFFSIPYDKGWNIKIDGKKQKLQQANIGFIGVMIDKGKHDIELRYIHPYFYLTLFVAIGGIIIFLSIFLINSKKKQV